MGAASGRSSQVSDEKRMLRAMRLRQQGLTPGASKWDSVAEVAQGMLAVQAQDPKAVLWSLSVRTTTRPAETATAGAFERGEVLRNRPSRGTLQVTAVADMAWLSALLTPRSNAAAVKRRERLGLTDELIEAVTEVIASELAGGGARTRAELIDAAARGGIELDGSQAGHVLRHLTERMVVVFAGAPGRIDSFTAGEPLVIAGRALSGEEALGELAARYFAGRGPATAQCLSWWANLTMGDARRAIEAAGDALETIELAGKELIAPAGSAVLTGAEVDEALAEPLLLAPFDEYLLGYRDRDPVVTPENLDAVVPGRNGMFKPIVVVDGEVVGIWSRSATASRVTVTVEPFVDLPADAVAGLGRRAGEYGEFLGLDAELVIES